MRERISSYTEHQRKGALSGRAQFIGILIEDINFSELNLHNVDFMRCKFKNCNFDCAILLGAKFMYCSGLHTCSFEETDYLDVIDHGVCGSFPLRSLDKFLQDHEEMVKVAEECRRAMYENETKEEEMFRRTFFGLFDRSRPSLKASYSSGDLPAFFKPSPRVNPYKHKPILSPITESSEETSDESTDSYETEVSKGIFRMDV